jgi:HK97 family phage portal protein
MLVRTRDGADRECRGTLDFDPSMILPPSLSGGWISPNPEIIWRPQDALQLPAVAACIHLIAETIGSLPCQVYRDRPDGGRERAVDSWQYRLLHEDGPNHETTPFDFLCDVAACIEASGNAYLEKLRVEQGQLQLVVVDPSRVRVRVASDGTKIFDVRTLDGRSEQLGTDRILHIRGFTIDGGPTGLSPIATHRRALGLVASREEYELEFFRNGASPGGVLEIPGAISEDTANEIITRWRTAHQGAGRWHQPALLTNGAAWKAIGVSLADAQFAESSKFSVEQIARIFRVPPTLLGIQTTRPVTAEQDAQHFYKFSLGPRLRRIESALAADPDLFPPALRLRPEFLADALLRADTQTRYDAYKAARQAGWLTANEIRAYENLPPEPHGDELQATPVGGAPNPSD